MTTKTALITGASSGIGLAAAAQLAAEDYGRVIATARTQEKAAVSLVDLERRTNAKVFVSEVVDLSVPATIDALADRLRDAGVSIDLLLLNAGMMSGATPKHDDQGFELTFSSSIIGHHQLTIRLLNDQMLAPKARIIIACSEVARGDVPMVSVIDVESFAAKTTDGDLVEALKRIAKAKGPGKFRPNDVYATAKACVAWWAAALARQLPPGMTVNAVSPGLTPTTNNARNSAWFARVVIPGIMKVLGIGGSAEEAAQNYIEVAKLDDTVTGKFFAAPAGKIAGPIVVQTQCHIINRRLQDATFEAIESLAGGTKLSAVKGVYK